MTKKILITGARGMLGSDVTKIFLENTEFDILATDKTSFDVTKKDQIEKYLSENKIDLLINCAAFTAVEQAEDPDNHDFLYELNAVAPEFLATATAEQGISFFHISTDYVFGNNDPEGYYEDNEPKQQLNAYGASKREGELRALKANPNTFICRTSWLYGNGGKNYVDTMLTLAESRSELNIVEDEIGIPTSTLEVARQLAYMVNNLSDLAPGYYHVVNEGACSRHEESQRIFEIAGIDMKLGKVKLNDYPRNAKVPHVSILKNTKLPKLKTWQQALTEYLSI